MVRREPPTECQPDKAEAVEGAPARSGASAPMERFKSLTKGLLGVSPAKLKAEQARYEAERPAKRKGKAKAGPA